MRRPKALPWAGSRVAVRRHDPPALLLYRLTGEFGVIFLRLAPLDSFPLLTWTAVCDACLWGEEEACQCLHSGTKEKGAVDLLTLATEALSRQLDALETALLAPELADWLKRERDNRRGRLEPKPLAPFLGLLQRRADARVVGMEVGPMLEPRLARATQKTAEKWGRTP